MCLLLVMTVRLLRKHDSSHASLLESCVTRKQSDVYVFITAIHDDMLVVLGQKISILIKVQIGFDRESDFLTICT